MTKDIDGLEHAGYEMIDRLHSLAYPDCPITHAHCHKNIPDEVTRP